MRLDRQSVYAIVAMLVFALIMGGIWVMQHGFGDDFGIGFSLGAVVGIALTITAVGWRRAESR